MARLWDKLADAGAWSPIPRGAAAMQQVADWLEKLGLGQYAQRFAENDIDFALLTKLHRRDLKELGVTSLGHRKRLLEAIAERTAATPSPTPAEPKVQDTAERCQDTAERRQVTVMFSDLVGSTALSARMDPEDLREVISAYQKSVAETVKRFGGFVAKYMGDGVLVYFGYPQAHEDDAERAVGADSWLGPHSRAGQRAQTSLDFECPPGTVGVPRPTKRRHYADALRLRS